MTMKRSLRIVAATEEHLDLIYSFSKEMAAFEETDFALSKDELHSMMFGDTKGLEGLIAYDNGKAIGFAVFFHNFPTFSGKRGLFIEDVWVTPTERGKGYGKALLGRLAELTLERNCCRMEWWTMDWNTRALEFYKGLGAQTKKSCIIHVLNDEALKELANSSS